VIIEDDEGIRSSLQELLEDEGYAVVTAENGKQGLEVLNALSDQPCVVLLDLMMPVMNGWQVLEALQKDEAKSEIPIIVVTAAGDRVGAPNVRRWLRKPLHLDTLLNVVEEHCAGHGATH
jgi:CheY-like chemotaxis protein